MNNAISGLTGYSPTINFQLPGLANNGPLRMVSSTAEALQTPGLPGSQDVLLDTNDPEIAYFRQIDSTGGVAVDRRRCVAEPEPSIEEIVDKKYVSKSDMDEFREETRRNVRELTESINRIAAGVAAITAQQSGTVDATAVGGDEKTVIHAAKRPKPSNSASANDRAKSRDESCFG